MPLLAPERERAQARTARLPKMNAHVERFNGSIQEEFIAYHEDLVHRRESVQRQVARLPGLVQHRAPSLRPWV